MIVSGPSQGHVGVVLGHGSGRVVVDHVVGRDGPVGRIGELPLGRWVAVGAVSCRWGGVLPLTMSLVETDRIVDRYTNLYHISTAGVNEVKSDATRFQDTKNVSSGVNINPFLP